MNHPMKVMKNTIGYCCKMKKESTPALATCQPRDESSETIPLSPSIIHMSDEELGCPGNYRWGIIAQWAKFQGNLQKRQSGVFYTNNGAYHHYSHSGAIISVYPTKYIGGNWQTCKNFRGILKTLKSCTCVCKTSSYLHYSHSGAILRVSYIPTFISTLCTWKSFRGGDFQSKYATQ